jgi:hypothetical protein
MLSPEAGRNFFHHSRRHRPRKAGDPVITALGQIGGLVASR